jgi:amidohydrolase
VSYPGAAAGRRLAVDAPRRWSRRRRDRRAVGDTPVVTNDVAGLLDEAGALQSQTVALRRALHRRPEVGLRLPQTQQAVLGALAGLPLRVRTGTEVDSVVAVLDGARPGRTVLLRGDMDALPMPEDTGLEFASATPGVMHACGHDTHVAMLVGAARLLAARRERIAGRVVFMFQPGEEGYFGARHMLDEGLLDADGPDADGADAGGAEPVSGAYALHTTTQHPTGTVNLRPGPQLASSNVLRITVRGAGAHASAPHEGLDPIPVACEIVQAIQTMVTRRFWVFDPVVVTIAQIVAGTTDNVIPEEARMLGTVRTLSEPTRQAVHAQLARLAEGVAAAHGLSAEVEIGDGYPATVNDAGAAELMRSAAADAIGGGSVSVMDAPVMGAEDWSYVLQRVPGAMAFLGACPPDQEPGKAPGNHSNKVVFDEPAMAAGVATYAAVALRHLAGLD